jgi:hypothetical protein
VPRITDSWADITESQQSRAVTPVSPVTPVPSTAFRQLSNEEIKLD